MTEIRTVTTLRSKRDEILASIKLYKENEASITMKLKRGTFAAAWLFACLAALELEGVRLEEI